MDITFELLKLIIISIIMAFVFGLIRYAKKAQETGETWDWLKFAPTAIYSVILGFIMAFTGVVNLNNLSNFASLFDGTWLVYLSLFTSILYAWENVVIPFIKARLTVQEFYPRSQKVNPDRKMDQETREKFFNDNPCKVAILNAVNDAEAKKTYRYTLAAGAWEYLVEFGEVTGGKRYLYKFWIGSLDAIWKEISSTCLEAIRSTGKWPDYDKLY